MRFFLLATFLLAAGCGSQSPSSSLPGDLENVQVPPPPAQLCAQAADGLKQLGDKAAVDYDDQGNATIVQEVWIGMGSDQHNKFAQTLALHAACTHPDGKGERKVLIRNDSGVILMEATISTNVGLGSLPPE